MSSRRVVVEVGEPIERARPAATVAAPGGPGWEELPPRDQPSSKAEIRPADLDAVAPHTSLPAHQRLAVINLRRRRDGLPPITSDQLAAVEARLGRRNSIFMTPPATRRAVELDLKERA
jgi:hypothetical protein